MPPMLRCIRRTSLSDEPDDAHLSDELRASVFAAAGSVPQHRRLRHPATVSGAAASATGLAPNSKSTVAAVVGGELDGGRAVDVGDRAASVRRSMSGLTGALLSGVTCLMEPELGS